MAKVWATMAIEGRFTKMISVKDPSDESELKSKIGDAFQDADFGDAEDIDGVLINAEDVNGDLIYEK